MENIKNNTFDKNIDNSSEYILEVNDINKTYGTNHVLKDVSFKMKKGEVLAIIGSSGGGKSTLLRSLTFLERIEKGSICIAGDEIIKQELMTIKPKKYVYEHIKKENKSLLSKIMPTKKIVRNPKTISEEEKTIIYLKEQLMISKKEKNVQKTNELKNQIKGLKLDLQKSINEKKLSAKNQINNLKKELTIVKSKYKIEKNEGIKNKIYSLQKDISNLKKIYKNPNTEIKEDFVSIYPKDDELREKRLKMGLVFQDFNLFPHKTVLENLMLAPMIVKKISKEEAESIAREVLQKVGLSDKADSYPCNISGGQKQRVAIARALCMSPDILCFDEPTSALDPELTGEVLKVISELRESGVTMIIVTHEIMFAREIADTVIFLDSGRILEMGNAKEVIDNPKEDRTKAFMDKILKA